MISTGSHNRTLPEGCERVQDITPDHDHFLGKLTHASSGHLPSESVMEALAAVSLVGTITQFVAYSTKLIERLNDFRSSAQNAPNAFHSVTMQLRLLRSNLEKTKVLASSGQLDAQTQQDVEAVVQDCQHQAERIEAMLKKVEPARGESKIRRGVKIVLSVHQEKDINEICKCIQSNVLHLVHHQTLNIQTTLPSRPAAPRSTSFSFMPFKKDHNFTGRTEQLEKLDELFQAGGRAALFGLGGAGKSQIAIEYSHRFLESDPGAIVLWIYASSISRIDQAYQEIAAKAKLPGFDRPDVSKYQLVSEWLSEEASGSWLMIIDNADAEDTFFSPLDSALHPGQQKTVSDFIPSAPNGKALITSRSRTIATKLTHRSRIVEVPSLNADEGRQMLENAIGEEKASEDADVKELLESLEYLPLAIAQAAAFIDENDVTIADYLELLKGGNQVVVTMLSDDIEDSRRDRDSLNSVIATWQLSFNYLRNQKPQAADLLSLMSMLDGKSIPERLLTSQNLTRIEFIKAVGMLKAFSLISEDNKSKKYTVHRLIHLATRVWIEKQGDAIEWHKKALDIIGEAFPAGKVQDWMVCNELEPHAEAVLAMEAPDEAQRIRMIDLLLRSAQDRYHQSHHNVAKIRASKALALSRILPKSSSSDLLIAKSMVILSWSYFGAKDYDTAVKTGEEALALFIEILGKDAPETMQARSRLSKFLMKQGKLEKAYEIQIATLKVQQETRGVDHEDTLFTTNRLIATLRKLKRYDEALTMSKELVAARRRISGENHPDTLSALFNRAVLLNNVGKLQEAIVAMQRSYEGFRHVFGEARVETMEALECLQEYEKELEDRIQLQGVASSGADGTSQGIREPSVELVFSPALGSPDQTDRAQWPFPIPDN